MASVVLATRNAHKVREVARILAPFGVTVEALPEEVVLPPEVADTFEGNALPKARAAAVALGRAAIGDDSGIEADALGGAPGVRSARYAGEHATDEENLAKLLREAPVGSGLRYVCALAFAAPADEATPPAVAGPRAGIDEHVFFGECRGRLDDDPRGENGFGYDPVFLPDDGPPGLTMAELDDDAKDTISHRGRAVRAFAEWFATRG
jgi:XTP/dITP diphosphohydrolase